MILQEVIYNSGSGVRQGDPIGPPSFQTSYDTAIGEWSGYRRPSDWAQRLLLTYVLPDKTIARADASTITFADDACHFSAALTSKELQSQLSDNSVSLQHFIALRNLQMNQNKSFAFLRFLG